MICPLVNPNLHLAFKIEDETDFGLHIEGQKSVTVMSS